MVNCLLPCLITRGMSIYIYIYIHFLCEDWQNKTKVYNNNCHWLPVFCTILYGKSQPGLCHLPSQHWLIGGIPTPLKNMSSSDRIIIRLGKWKNPWFQTTNQLSDTQNTHSIPQYTKISRGALLSRNPRITIKSYRWLSSWKKMRKSPRGSSSHLFDWEQSDYHQVIIELYPIVSY